MPSSQTPDTPPPVTGAGESETQDTTLGPDAQKVLDEVFEVVEDAPKAEEPAKEDPKPEVEAPPAADKAPAKDAEPAKDEKPAGDEPREPELPKVPHPLAEADDPDIDDVDPKYTKIRQKFEKQREKMYEARQQGAFGRTLVDLARANGVDPQALAAYVQRSIKLAKDDPAAIAEVAAELQKRGVRFAEPQQDASKAIDAEAERIFKEEFAPAVQARRIDEDYAREQARKMAERSKPAQREIVIPPRPEPQAQPTINDLVKRGRAEVTEIDRQYAALYRSEKMDYTPIQAEAVKRVREQGNPEDPRLWAWHYSQTVRQVQQEMLAKKREQAAPRVKVTNTMTPSTHPTRSTGSRSLADVKNELADDPTIFG